MGQSKHNAGHLLSWPMPIVICALPVRAGMNDTEATMSLTWPFKPGADDTLDLTPN